jgi:glycosyltransferase involved in cell wall biosynthesis
MIPTPLISCILPTANRRAFVPRAIRYFLAQDYPRKELVILDDGADAVGDLVPADPQLRYVRLGGRRTLGKKRNECVEAASGDLIMHWDDDDWHAPHRMRYQAEALLAADAEVCSVTQMLFYELDTGKTWLYSYTAKQLGWLAGGTLLYTRDFWRRAPFPDIQVASDTRFVANRRLDRALVLPSYDFYVAMIHPGNTSPKRRQGAFWAEWPGDLRAVMGQDLELYRPQRGQAAGGRRQEPAQCDPTPPLRLAERRLGGEVDPPPAAPPPTICPALTPHQNAAGVAAGLPSPTSGRGAGGKGDLQETPVVSCILATGNRPEFTRQAIRCFLRQTFDRSELIVVDDGAEPVADLCSGLFRVRYIRLQQPTPLGTKLNLGIEQARGSIIQKLDDDDFYHATFLDRAVAALRQKPGANRLVTWDCFMILLAGEQHVRFSGHGWTTGGTLCFPRALWEQRPFRAVPRQVDTFFIEDNRPQLIRVCAPELYILVRHGRNTWTELSNGRPVDSHFQRLALYHRPLNDLIEPIDRVFYASLSY